MKPTHRAVVEAFIIASIITALAAWLLPAATGWLLAVIWLALITGGYKARVEMMAHETLANSKKL